MTEEQKNEQAPAKETEDKNAGPAPEAAQDAQETPAPEKQEPEAIEKAIEEAKATGKQEQIKLPDIKPGMLIRVHQKIKEVAAKGAKGKDKEKERIQVFEGVVLAVRGSGNQKTFTVRKKSQGIGVEKIYPMSAPCVEKVEVMKEYRTKRAKLGFLRKGYKKKLKEKMKRK